MAFDFDKLKTVARRLGGILVMQGNDPEFVIMSYDKYAESETQAVPVRTEQPDEQLIDQLNREISALKEEIRQKEISEVQTI